MSAHAAALLPSQEEEGSVTVKTCRDRGVLSSLKAAIDSSLKTTSVLARGMQARDIHLEAIWLSQPAVICSITVAARGLRERIIYTVAVDGAAYVIKFGGEPGDHRLFPDRLEVRPIINMQPDCSGPISTRPQKCVDRGSPLIDGTRQGSDFKPGIGKISSEFNNLYNKSTKPASTDCI